MEGRKSQERTSLLIGQEAMARLESARVIVFGVGGVGGYAAEALARCGIARLDLVDHDRVVPSNLNRQIIATEQTLGMLKVEAAKERIALIDPELTVHTWPVFYGPDTADLIDFSAYDYVADAVDTVTAKLFIIQKAKAAGVPVISAMGAGNKLDPSRFCVADIYETSVCPLARVMRRELKKRGIRDLKVVYSTEKPFARGREAAQQEAAPAGEGYVKQSPGSISFVPAAAGLCMAGEIIRSLAGVSPLD